MARLRGVMVAAVLAAMLLPAVPAQAASITVKGRATCANGKKVVGIWVQSSGGGSRWAAWTPVSGKPHQATYSTTLSTSTPTNVQLHIGCGGTKTSWWSNNKTYSTRLTASVTRNATCKEASGTGLRCKYQPTGTNPFSYGQCTHGAAKLWAEHQGAYPNWRGDARLWATNAKDQRWTVSSTPRTRAILVIQPGPWPPSSATRGHVAWVNRINRYSSGKVVSLNITDMNGRVAGGWATYDRPYKASGMSFIYAP